MRIRPLLVHLRPCNYSSWAKSPCTLLPQAVRLDCLALLATLFEKRPDMVVSHPARGRVPPDAPTLHLWGVV